MPAAQLIQAAAPSTAGLSLVTRTLELRAATHPVPGELCVLYGLEKHFEQCLLLWGPQVLQQAAIEPAKQSQVYVAVCQACEKESSSVPLTLLFKKGGPCCR